MCEAFSLEYGAVGELEIIHDSKSIKQHIYEAACDDRSRLWPDEATETSSELKFISLQQLIGPQMPLRIRLRLAAVLASTTLQLYGTEWQKEYWLTEDVRIPVVNKCVRIGRPMFSKELSRTSYGSASRPESTVATTCGAGFVNVHTLICL